MLHKTCSRMHNLSFKLPTKWSIPPLSSSHAAQWLKIFFQWLEILHTELKPIKTISQIKINSECIFSLESEFSSQKIHSESEGIESIDFNLWDGFNWFWLDHKARFMCIADIGRLQRLSRHELKSEFSSQKIHFESEGIESINFNLWDGFNWF